MTKKIDALLLSAGKSSRMGFTKALVDWHNQKLIQFQVETLLSSCLLYTSDAADE